MESRQGVWLREKKCAVCGQRLGLNSMKQKKLYCQFCSHAICTHCTTNALLFSPLARKRACCICVASSAPLSVATPLCEDFGQDGYILVESGFSGLSELMDPPQVEVSVLADSDARESPLGRRESGGPEALEIQIAEKVALSPPEDEPTTLCHEVSSSEFPSIPAKSEGFASDSLTPSVEELTAQVAALRALNSELEKKIKDMEAKVPSPSPPTSRSKCLCCSLQ